MLLCAAFSFSTFAIVEFEAGDNEPANKDMDMGTNVSKGGTAI